jgi:pSer/pThr/pTyr-binding forkhead associated (FHA) protein
VIESVEVVIRQPGQPDRTLRLQPGSTLMGRAEDNELVLADVGVSRKHACLTLDGDQLLLEDMGSGNGTYFNGSRIQTQVIQDGDEVVIDPFILLFRLQGAQGTEPRESVDAPARLEVVVGTGLAGSTYPLTADHSLTIGRSEECDLVIPDPAASRHHTTVSCESGKWVLHDKGAANGIFVNESRVRRATLLDNDVIRIGNTELRFVLAATTLGDTASQVVPGEVWNPQAGRSQAAISAAPTPSPLPEIDAVEGGGRGTLVAAMLGGIVALLVILALVSVGLLGLVLYLTNTLASVSDHEQPTWVVECTTPLPSDADAYVGMAIQHRTERRSSQVHVAGHNTLVARADVGRPPAERTHRNWTATRVSEEQDDAVAAAEHLEEVRRSRPESPAFALNTPV